MTLLKKKIAKSDVMLVVGMMGILFETIQGNDARPDLIAAFVTVISLSVAVRGDETRKKGQSNGGD